MKRAGGLEDDQGDIPCLGRGDYMYLVIPCLFSVRSCFPLRASGFFWMQRLCAASGKACMQLKSHCRGTCHVDCMGEHEDHFGELRHLDGCVLGAVCVLSFLLVFAGPWINVRLKNLK